MVPSYRTQETEDAKSFLEQVQAGAAANNITLPEELNTNIGTSRDGLQANLSHYGQEVRWDTQNKESVKQTRETGYDFLRRMRQRVGSHLPRPEKLAVRRQYGLAQMPNNNSEHILQALATVKSVSENLEEASLKLSQPTTTRADELAQALQEGLESVKHSHAVQVSLREERVELIIAFRQLRTHIYGFLMETLEEGCRDERLIDFGFKPSILRRKAARPDTGDEVVVVTEVETGVVETPVPVEP